MFRNFSIESMIFFLENSKKNICGFYFPQLNFSIGKIKKPCSIPSSEISTRVFFISFFHLIMAKPKHANHPAAGHIKHTKFKLIAQTIPSPLRQVFVYHRNAFPFATNGTK